MAPPFWVRCNRCFAQYSNKTKFFVLNCGHVACKACLVSHNSAGGDDKKCPVCSASVKFTDLTKLNDMQKNFFKPNPSRLLEEPLKCIKFQAKQQKILFDYMCSVKQKAKRVAQKAAEAKQELIRLQKIYESKVAMRRKMQEKLREIWSKKGSLNQPQAYRNPNNATLSTVDNSIMDSSKATPVSSYRPYAPTTASSKSSVAGFFDKDAPMFQSQTIQKASQIDRKKPLFA